MSKKVGLVRAVAGSVALIALSACLWLSYTAGTAKAAPEEQPPTYHPVDRTWENYFGATILSSGRAIVVGDKGLVMTSDDKGKTWSRQQLKNGLTPFDLYSVAFTSDGAVGWIAGDGGSLFKSTDQGKTWTLQPTKLAAALMKVAVVDAQKACAVGEHGAVVCTSDGGTTMNASKFEDLVFFDVTFTDPNTGWGVGEFQTVLNTADGGKTWAIKYGGQRTLKADPYFAVAFEKDNGLVLGLNGITLTTADAGKTWKEGTLSGEPYSFYSAVPLASGETYVGGVDGLTGRITGDKLTRTTSGASNSINAVAFASDYGIAVGLSGTLLSTTDNGQTWSSLDKGESAQARAQ
ncbi:MAG TPA: YCF48-related protein [Candidatus Binataceae bacterium]|nr:YCF48-related protein [Candidatus Binataceae bacterium]